MTRIEEIQQKATKAGDARFRRSERERMAYVLGWIHGGQWADYTMLNNVCEWIEDNIWDYIETKSSIDFDILKEVKVSEMVENLRKVMEQ